MTKPKTVGKLALEIAKLFDDGFTTPTFGQIVKIERLLHQELQKAREEGYRAGKKAFLKDITRLDHSTRGQHVSYIIFDEAGTIDWDKVSDHSELDQPTTDTFPCTCGNRGYTALINNEHYEGCPNKTDAIEI